MPGTGAAPSGTSPVWRDGRKASVLTARSTASTVTATTDTAHRGVHSLSSPTRARATIPLRFWLPAYSAKPARVGSQAAWRKNRADSRGLRAQHARVTPDAVATMVAAARHCLRTRSTTTAMAGVSLKAAARPHRTPRQRELAGTASRSTATRAARTALTWAYSMVL